jgi:hypothetical protein
MAALLVGAVFFPFGVLKQKSSEEKKVFILPFVAALVIVSIEFVSLLMSLFSENGFQHLPVSFVVVTCFWVLLLKPGSFIVKQSIESQIILGCAHVLSIFGLYRLSADAGSLAVSASWLVYAVGILTVSYFRKDVIMAKSALFVLGFAGAKALLYDASTAPTEVRILCLLLTGAVLYGCGIFMRRVSQWSFVKSG